MLLAVSFIFLFCLKRPKKGKGGQEEDYMEGDSANFLTWHVWSHSLLHSCKTTNQFVHSHMIFIRIINSQNTRQWITPKDYKMIEGKEHNILGRSRREGTALYDPLEKIWKQIIKNFLRNTVLNQRKKIRK